MRSTLFMLFLFIGSLNSTTGQSPFQEKKVKVLILGVFHFVSNNDIVKYEKENMLSDKRQAEINELNAALLKLKPTKIFIEWRPSAQRYTDSSYEEYRNNRFVLTGNEIHQIGFKLANQLNHPKLYCMDAPGQYLYDTVTKTADKYGQLSALDAYYNSWRQHSLKEDSLQKKLTILQRLRYVNQKDKILESHHLNAGITSAAYVGAPGNYAAAEFIGEWYKRNARMYSNIVRQVENKDEFILVIVGAGHARIIQHFFEDNPMYEVIDPLKVLR